MKRELYIKPQFEILEVVLEEPIATSVVVTDSSSVVNETWVEDTDVTADINWIN